jgi:hypothetical protein
VGTDSNLVVHETKEPLLQKQSRGYNAEAKNALFKLETWKRKGFWFFTCQSAALQSTGLAR